MTVNDPRTMVAYRFTPAEVAKLIARSELLLGRSLQSLLGRYGQPGRTAPRHRLIELLLRMRAAAANPDSLIAGVAVVNAPELHAILDFYGKWSGSPAWPELQRMLNAPREFLHTVAMLALLDQIRLRHPNTDIVTSTGNTKHADLVMRLGQRQLAVEVKGRQELWGREAPLSMAESIQMNRHALEDARGQLSLGRPGILAICGYHLGEQTFTAVAEGAKVVLTTENRWPYVLGIAIHDLGVQAGWERENLASVWLVQRSRLARNRFYAAPLKIDGPWDGDWRLR